MRLALALVLLGVLCVAVGVAMTLGGVGLIVFGAVVGVGSLLLVDIGGGDS